MLNEAKFMLDEAVEIQPLELPHINSSLKFIPGGEVFWYHLVSNAYHKAMDSLAHSYLMLQLTVMRKLIQQKPHKSRRKIISNKE